MSTDTQSAMAMSAAQSTLARGAKLSGGRYHIHQAVRQTPFGTIYRADDTATGNPVSIHLLAPHLVAQANVAAALQQSIARAADIDHKNIARVLDVATEGHLTYTVCEFLDGHTLRELLARRLGEGQSFSPKQVGNIAAHLCAAAEAAGALGGHGAVSLETATVNNAGRVKLLDLGLGAIAGAHATPALAPEVRAGGPVTSAADVFSIGAVVYELLVGKAPAVGCARPSALVPGLSPLVDQLVAATMSPDPAKRPRIEQLAPAIAKSFATVSAAQPAPATAGPDRAPRPSLAQAITAPRTSAQRAATQDALNQALTDKHERWLISKGKLDYGPFSLAAIVEQIEKNVIQPGHVLVDNDTGTRCNVEDHPLLTDLVDEARQARDDARRAEAEVVHAKQERRRGATLYVVIAAALLGLGGGAILLVKALSSDSGGDKSTIAGLEEGTLEAKITFVSDDQAKKRRGRSGSKGKKSGAVDGTSGGWDDSLDLDMENDSDSAGSGGDETLSNSQVNAVIQQHGNQLARCLTSTGSREAFIEFMVKGTGKVYQVRVNGETNTNLAKCMRKAMMSMQFPTFNGMRSKHNFDMAF